jgi:hypothetical protein
MTYVNNAGGRSWRTDARQNNVRMDIARTGGDFCRLHPAGVCMSDETETIARYRDRIEALRMIAKDAQMRVALVALADDFKEWPTNASTDGARLT